jgi:hypothetical protein
MDMGVDKTGDKWSAFSLVDDWLSNGPDLGPDVDDAITRTQDIIDPNIFGSIDVGVLDQ